MTVEEIVEGYEGVVDEEYLAEEGERRELFDWIADRMSHFTSDGKRLFEVGSNVGLFLAVAAERGWDVAGVEPSAWAVAQGRERFGVDLRQGTAEELALEPGSVDALVMLDVLEHLHDPMTALAGLRPFVHDRGILVLSTVNVESLHGRLRGERWPWFIRSHLHYFRPPTLVSMLARNGFEVVEWKIVPRSFHLSYVLHRAAGTFPGSGLIEGAASVIDPKIPVGWIGDVTMVVARPRPS